MVHNINMNNNELHKKIKKKKIKGEDYSKEPSSR
jgi:hypothetical protein